VGGEKCRVKWSRVESGRAVEGGLVFLGEGRGTRPYVFVTFTPAETEEARVVSYEGDSCAGLR